MKRLSPTISWGWAIGTIGPTTLLYVVNYSLMYFMTDMIGIAAALAGVLVFGTRLFDIAFDLAVGVLSDRTTSRWGRRRPWMAGGAVLSAAGCGLLFNCPAAFRAGSGTLIWIGFCLVIYFAGYSMFNVPYLAMPAEMTTDYAERTSLMSKRVMFVSISGFIGISGANWLLAWYGKTLFGYGRMSLEIAIIGLLAMLIPVYATRGAPATHRPAGRRETIWEQFRTAAENRPFVVLILAKLMLLLALSSITTGMFYFIVQVMHRGPGALSLYGLATNLGILLSLPVWVRIGRLADKRNLFILTVAAGIPLSLSWMLATAAEPDFIFLGRSVLIGVFAGGSLLMGQALLPDAIEYDYATTGLRREATFSAVYSFVEKASFAFGPLIVGFILASSGYVSSRVGHAPAVESASALRGVHMSIALLPAAAASICIFLLLFYDLGEEKLKMATASRRALEQATLPDPRPLTA
jgi:GPH family glycoside/pentoside/hexuronide:cation symporter